MIWFVGFISLAVLILVGVTLLSRGRGQSGAVEDPHGAVGVAQAISRQGQVP